MAGMLISGIAGAQTVRTDAEVRSTEAEFALTWNRTAHEDFQAKTAEPKKWLSKFG